MIGNLRYNGFKIAVKNNASLTWKSDVAGACLSTLVFMEHSHPAQCYAAIIKKRKWDGDL